MASEQSSPEQPQNTPPPPIPPQSSSPYPQRPRKRLWPKLLIIALVISVIMNFWLAGSGQSMYLGGSNKVREKYHSLNRYGSQKVAVINLEGAIISGEGFVKNQIDRVRQDEDVKAVVLRINSPGGSVSASDYLYHHLKKMTDEREIPLVVSMGGICASGGYYVAMAVEDTPESIFAEPTTWTGSIGVIIPHYNLAGLLERWKIEDDSIASHELKGMGSMTREMTEQERAIFQELVDQAFDRFKSVIQQGRPAQYGGDKIARLEELATGQVYTTDQALANGLVDKQGFVEDAVDRVIELASLDKEEVKVVEYEQQPTLFGSLFGMEAMSDRSLDLGALLDLTTPRAYYLFTWPPAARE